jgi:BirA family biotin operon repressor/biotin-[acetyl-CoA-carboxylase] ligase
VSTKKNLLALLEENRGKNISGEFIAGQLNVSRTAIWKAVKELEKDGYKIKAATKTGYCLSNENDILSVQGMRKFLNDKNAKILIYPSLDSTMTMAKQLAIADAEHGTVVIANHQTAGKGRYGRSFFSPPGQGVYMSFILHPAKIWLQTPTLITAFAGVAVCEAVEAVSGKISGIKWVNDVFLNGKKICGILTEAITDYESGEISWLVSGIGVNFTTPETHIIGSVFANEKPPTTRNHLAAEIINRMSSLNDPTGDEKILLEKYKSSLMMLGKKIIVSGAQSYEATALDIDDAGRLIVKKSPNGEIISLSSGEVSVAVNSL